MQTDVTWSADVLTRCPELAICIGTITGIHNQKENDQLRQLKKTVYEEAKEKNSAEALKDNSTVRAYRDFYWKLDIDPTKTRPSGEALIRRVLNGNELPNLSTGVDAYNLASMQTVIPQRVRQRQAEPTVPHPLRKERGIHGNRNGQTHEAHRENAHPNRRKTGPLRLPLPRF